MQTSRQVFSSDFVYLLHAAAQAPREPSKVLAEGEEDDEDLIDEEDEDEDDARLKEIDFDD